MGGRPTGLQGAVGRPEAVIAAGRKPRTAGLLGNSGTIQPVVSRPTGRHIPADSLCRSILLRTICLVPSFLPCVAAVKFFAHDALTVGRQGHRAKAYDDVSVRKTTARLFARPGRFDPGGSRFRPVSVLAKFNDRQIPSVSRRRGRA